MYRVALTSSRLYYMPPKWYHKYVTNDLTLNQTINFVKEHCVPSSSKVASTIESIDFNRPHKPLLFITDVDSVTDYKEFPNRTHNVLSQDNWQEVASYTIKWINNQNT